MASKNTEAPTTGQQSLRCVIVEEGKTYCKCAEGWTCEFTKTESSKAGKPFAKCESSCTCVTDANPEQEANLQQTLENSTEGKVIAKCGEGWTCTISKTEGPDAGKIYVQCGEGCICSIDENNGVNFARV